MQPLRRITRYCRRSRLLYTAVIPFIVICILSGIMAAMFHRSIPHTTEKAEWVNFTKTLVIHSDQRVSPQRLTILSLTLCSQYLFGVPFMNITKILYGYWFGFLSGLILCTIVEILCTLPIILWAASNTHTDESLIHIIDDFREKRCFWINLLMFQLTGLPIYTKLPLLMHNAVTQREFTISFFSVTIVMTAKNTLVGTLIYHYPQHAVILGTVVGVLTILPSLMVVYLGTSVFQSRSFWVILGTEEREEENEEREDGPLRQ